MPWLLTSFPVPTASQLAQASKFLSDNSKSRERLKLDTFRYGNPLSREFNLIRYTTALTAIRRIDSQFQQLATSVPVWENADKSRLSIGYYQYLSENINFKTFYNKLGEGTSSSDNFILDSKWADWVINAYNGDDVVSVGAGGHRVFVNLGAGNDIFNGGVGSDGVFGGIGNDILNGGNGFDVLDGCDGDDRILGGLGTDLLSGANGNDFLNGGSGDDLMDGGVGNDTYIVDSAGDVVTEATSAGTDTVQSSVTYTLSGNVENLVLTGTATINGTGNALNNTITGNIANNILNGGAGVDALTGGLGADIFRFDSLLNASTNVDRITDFTPTAVTSTTDRIQLENTGAGLFTAITALGTLAANAFVSGTAFTNSSQRIRYDGISGNLFYDADGNGTQASILFANLSTGLALNNTHFVVS